VGLVALLVEVGAGIGAGLLRPIEVLLQFVDPLLLLRLLALQILAPLHHLQQRVLQAGPAAFEGLDLVLQLGELLGVHRPGGQQCAVAVLAFAHAVDLVLQLGDLPVEIGQFDLQRTQPVTGRPMLGLHLVEPLLFGQVLRPVVDAGQLGVEPSHFQQ